MTPRRRLHWYRHAPADHIARTLHLGLEEEGILRRLLDAAWLADGRLADDLKKIAKTIRAPKSKQPTIACILDEFFERTAEGWIEPELAAQRADAVEVSARRQEYGRKGGMANGKARALAKARAKASESGEQIESDTDTDLLTQADPDTTPARATERGAQTQSPPAWRGDPSRCQVFVIDRHRVLLPPNRGEHYFAQLAQWLGVSIKGKSRDESTAILLRKLTERARSAECTTT